MRRDLSHFDKVFKDTEILKRKPIVPQVNPAPSKPFSEIDYLSNAKSVREKAEEAAVTRAKRDLEHLYAGRAWIAIPLDQIEPNPWQPRVNFALVKQLAADIRENGLDTPIQVRKLDNGKYQIADGETRWRAFQENAEDFDDAPTEIPAIVKEYTDEEMAFVAFRSALQRKDLDPLEEARGFQKIIKDFGTSQAEIAKRIGKHQTYVSDKLRLLDMPEDVFRIFRQEKIKEGHALELAQIKDEKIRQALGLVAVTEGISVNALVRRKRLIRMIEESNLGESSKDRLVVQVIRGQVGEAEVLGRLEESTVPNEPTPVKSADPIATQPTTPLATVTPSVPSQNADTGTQSPTLTVVPPRPVEDLSEGPDEFEEEGEVEVFGIQWDQVALTVAKLPEDRQLELYSMVQHKLREWGEV